MAKKVKKNIKGYNYKRNGKVVRVPNHKRTYMIRKNRGAAFGIDQFPSGARAKSVIQAGQARDFAKQQMADVISDIELSSKLAAKKQAAEERRKDEIVDLEIMRKRKAKDRATRFTAGDDEEGLTLKEIREAENAFAKYKREQAIKPVMEALAETKSTVGAKAGAGITFAKQKLKGVKLPKFHRKVSEIVDAENDAAKTKFFTLDQLKKREQLKQVLEKVGFHRKEPNLRELNAELERSGFRQPPDIDFKKRKHDVESLLEHAGFGGFNTKDIIEEIKVEKKKPKKITKGPSKAEIAVERELNLDDYIDAGLVTVETKNTRGKGVGRKEQAGRTVLNPVPLRLETQAELNARLEKEVKKRTNTKRKKAKS